MNSREKKLIAISERLSSDLKSMEDTYCWCKNPNIRLGLREQRLAIDESVRVFKETQDELSRT